MVDLRTKPLTRAQIGSFIGSERGIRSYEDMQTDIGSQYEALTSASFLVVNSEPTLGSERTLTIGTGLHGTDGGPNSPFTIINTAPDLVVTLTGAGTTAVTGTYPNFTITSNDQFAGTVTSVGASVPTGFSIAGSPVTTSGTLAITYAAGYQGYTTTESTKLGLITSGTYTPTLTAIANISAVTAFSAQYSRNGSIVTVSVMVQPTITAAGVATMLDITLPIASNFANANECVGVGGSADAANTSAVIYADVAGDKARLQFLSSVTGARNYFCHFTYQII